MHSVLTMSLDGVPYGPSKVEAGDANTTLVAAAPEIVTNTNVFTGESRKALRIVLTCENNPIRYAFGGIIPTQAGLGHILYPGASLVIGHPAGIASFRYINHTNAANAILQVTGEYNE